MDKYLITKFKSEHANYILSYGEIENYSKQFDTQTLETTDSWTGFFGNEPVACGGIYKMWDTVAEVWIIMRTGSNNKHKFFMLRNMKKYLDETIEKNKYKRIQSTVRADFDEGIKFAKWFGMESEGLMKQYGPDGKDYLRLARIL